VENWSKENLCATAPIFFFVLWYCNQLSCHFIRMA
jgi:hypothetical protein